jgi:hypothetical protein
LLTELLADVDEAVHRLVVIEAEMTQGGEDETGVAVDEEVPGALGVGVEKHQQLFIR